MALMWCRCNETLLSAFYVHLKNVVPSLGHSSSDPESIPGAVAMVYNTKYQLTVPSLYCTISDPESIPGAVAMVYNIYNGWLHWHGWAPGATPEHTKYQLTVPSLYCTISDPESIPGAVAMVYNIYNGWLHWHGWAPGATPEHTKYQLSGHWGRSPAPTHEGVITWRRFPLYWKTLHYWCFLKVMGGFFSVAKGQ